MKSIRVLVVDDDPAVLRLLVTALRYEGILAHGASDALAAFQMLDQLHPDLVLTDYRMPAINGLELAAWVQDHPEHAGIPVVLMSAGNVPTDAGFADSGCRGYLPKPINMAHLGARVRAYLPTEHAHALEETAHGP